MTKKIPLMIWLAGLLLITGSMYGQEEGCRLKVGDLEPIIARYNPFFADHKWNQKSQMEIARMSDDRLLIITQDGCKRHHITFTMVIGPDVLTNQDSFWVNEVKSMMHKVYFERKIYDVFGEDFERNFEEKFKLNGINRQFNFPVGTRNFICELRYDPAKGARISVEMVRFIFKEKVELKRKGIPIEQDDGWMENNR